MKKIMLSALAAVLSFGCFQNVEAGPSASARRSPSVQQQTAATPAPAQQYTPAAQTPAQIDAAAQANIVSYINTECAFKNVSGWPLNLKNHFRKLARAIQSNNTSEINSRLANIASFKSKKQWNDATGKVKPVREEVLSYFESQPIYATNGVLNVARTALADF